MMYRFFISTSNVYRFAFLLKRCLTLMSDKNQVQGFVKKEEVLSLIAEVRQYQPGAKIKLVTSERYWKQFDFYSYNFEM